MKQRPSLARRRSSLTRGFRLGSTLTIFPMARSVARRQQTVACSSGWMSRAKNRSSFGFTIFDPHAPYSPPSPYKASFATDPRQREYLSSVDISFAKFPRIRAGHNAYDGEIRYTDEHVRHLFDRIREQGLWENSTIVLTADHGEALGQHAWLDHGRIYNEQLHIPLIVKFASTPGHRAQRLTRVASLVDVVPTLVEELEIAVPDNLRSRMQGINLMRSENERPFVFAERVHRHRDWESGLKFALISRDWKLFHLTEHPDELYNMRTDRGEKHNVIEKNAETSRRMLAHLRKIRTKRFEDDTPADRLGDSEREREILRQLRSLGYVDR